MSSILFLYMTRPAWPPLTSAIILSGSRSEGSSLSIIRSRSPSTQNTWVMWLLAVKVWGNFSHSSPRSTIWQKCTERLCFKASHRSTASELVPHSEESFPIPVPSPILSSFPRIQFCIWFDKISSFVACQLPHVLGGNSPLPCPTTQNAISGGHRYYVQGSLSS